MISPNYCSKSHQGIENWSVTLIDQAYDLDSVRKKELYWINRWNTWVKIGLNVREVYEAYNWVKTEKKNFFRKRTSQTHENLS